MTDSKELITINNQTGQHEENDFYADGRADDVFDGQIIPPAHASVDTQERREELSRLTDAEVLLQGRRALYADLVIAVETGIATPQEKAILAGLLKNSGMDMMDVERIEHATKTTPEEDKAPLPQFAKPEYT